MTRQLHLGAILAGVGSSQNDWLHPDLPGDASVNIDWYIESARRAEAAKFDLVFIVDSPYITADTAPHFLNRLEPLTLLSAIAVNTASIGLVATLTTSFWRRILTMHCVTGAPRNSSTSSKVFGTAMRTMRFRATRKPAYFWTNRNSMR
jgi:hypothetical protein